MTPASPLDVEVMGEGPDLVLLHGGSGSRDDLAALRARLEPGRRVIAPDQRAHGRSPDLGELTYAAMAADTAALLDGLGSRGADIVGWSDGGIIGLFLARDRPDLVGRLVAISANVSSAPPAPAAMSEKSRAWIAAATAVELPMPAVREDRPGAADEWPSIVAKLRTMWLDEPGIDLADLDRISAPILYLAGDHDAIRTDHTVAMAAATPGATLAIVPGVGHGLAQERVDEVAAIVERFLGLRSPIRELRVALTVDDHPGALAFYRDALGLHEIADWSTPAGKVTVLDAGRATLELLDHAQAATVDDLEVGRRVSGTIRLALEVDDSVAMSERLIAAGATHVGGPVVTPWRDRSVRIAAPDGLQLTLFTVVD